MKTIQRVIAVLLACWLAAAPAVVEAQSVRIPPYFWAALSSGRKLAREAEQRRKAEGEEQKKQARPQQQQRKTVPQPPSTSARVGSYREMPERFSAQPASEAVPASAAPVTVTVQDNRQELREIQAALDTLNKNLSEWKNLEPEKINVSAAELRAAIAEGESLKTDLTGLAETMRLAVEDGTRSAVKYAQASIDSAKDATISRLQQQLKITEQNQQMLMARLEKQEQELAARNGRGVLLGVSAFGFALGTVIHIWGEKESWIFVGEAISYTVAVGALIALVTSSFKTEPAMNLPSWSLDKKVQKLVESPAYFGDKENGIDSVALAEVIAHAPWVADYFEDYTATIALMNKYPEMDLSAYVKDFEALSKAQQTNPEYFRRMARAAKLYDRRVQQGIMQKRVDFAKLYLQGALR